MESSPTAAAAAEAAGDTSEKTSVSRVSDDVSSGDAADDLRVELKKVKNEPEADDDVISVSS